MWRWPDQIYFLLVAITVSTCNPNGALENPLNSAAENIIEVEANSDGVFAVTDAGSDAIPVEETVTLSVGESITVDEVGRATIRWPDLLTAELTREGRLSLEQVVVDELGGTVKLQQSGGLLLVEFNSDGEQGRRLTIRTELATISTPGAQLLLVHEVDSPVEWIVNLGETGDLVEIDGAGVTQRVAPDSARWIGLDGTVSDEIPADNKRLRSWYNSVLNDEAPLTLAEVLLSPANVVGTTGELPALPRVGQAFELAPSEQGAVRLTLDPIGIFGNPRYALEDCNGDGSQDIAIQAGKLKFDFQPLLARVLALDVTVLNQAQSAQGALWGLDSAGSELGRDLLEVGSGESQTLDLRSDRPFATAELALLDGCFFGFSLTPPSSTGAPSEPRAIITPQPVDEVVNILATPEQRASDVGPLEAVPVGAGAIKIDGQLDDWEALTGSGDSDWIELNAITFDEGCANRFPDSSLTTDLAGQVRFAYSDQNLYVAFRVDDDGYVGYAGGGENYFLGDSPQLSLDLDLTGDFDDAGRSQDDWQVDILPDGESPQVALWQLGSLTSGPFAEAQVAVTATDTGYVVEAALPWESFGVSPQAGDRLGIAANINDSDTPGSNAQECIISTAPQRRWDDPTSWGTLFLRPTE